MANWYDLSPEVKHLILQYAMAGKSIIHLPRHRRWKKDPKWSYARHVDDILLVSKGFVTVEEFSFAMLPVSKVTLNSVSEFRKLVRKVMPDVKKRIRCLHFRRHREQAFGTMRDSFSTLSSIRHLLSSEFPHLEQIHLSMRELCVKIGAYFSNNEPQKFITKKVLEEILEYASTVGDKDSGDIDFAYAPSHFTPFNPLQHAALIFLCDHCPFWVEELRVPRLAGWLPRLLKYTENAGIEVILHFDLCVRGVVDPVGTDRVLQNIAYAKDCWSVWFAGRGPNTSLHIPAEMSTRDYTLKVVLNDSTYEIPQTLMKEMVHEYPYKDPS